MKFIQTKAPLNALRWAQTSGAVSVLAVLVLAGALTACGGDPYNDPEVIPSLPAATSVEFSQFVSKRMPDDINEPLEVEAVAPPTSESEEPIDVA